jgi:hypothetical protein
MVNTTRVSGIILTLIFAMYSTAALAETPYVEMRRAGIDYMIATFGIDEQKKLSCSYVFMKSKTPSYAKVKNIVLEKLNSKDRNDALLELPNLEKDIRLGLGDIYRMINNNIGQKIDSKTSCGALFGFSAEKYSQAEMRWRKAQEDLIKQR